MPTPSTRAPGWPSLAWAIGPQSALATEPVLWYQQDMLLFTLLWTVVVFFVVFTAVGLVAFAMFHRHRAGVFLLVGFSAWGVITGAASGAIVGNLLQGRQRLVHQMLTMRPLDSIPQVLFCHRSTSPGR
nr:hypothetical protein HK105_005609 [Polyrhizophydium stewartii]